MIPAVPQAFAGIVRLPDTPTQAGHWFNLSMGTSEVKAIKGWCRQNFGRPSRMSGSLRTGWVAEQPDRAWSMLTHYSHGTALRSAYLVFWTPEAAALFMLFHPPW